MIPLDNETNGGSRVLFSIHRSSAENGHEHRSSRNLLSRIRYTSPLPGRIDRGGVNTILNISAFLRVARLGSFSAAAREMNVATSVIAKRISQLEKEVKTKLIARSTRGVTLTAAGERQLPQFGRLLAAYEQAFLHQQEAGSHRVEGWVRILAPPTVTSMFLGPIFTRFQLQYSKVDMDIVALERSANPLEEGFDIAVGGWPLSYPDVVDVQLCRYELMTVAAPVYLKGKQMPRHPTELIDHDCLTTTLFRTSWGFTNPRGAVNIEVHSRLQSSDSRMVRDAARMGLGIGILPRMLVEDDLREGTLVELLEDFPVAPYWLKLLVPRMKMSRPVVSALVRFLKDSIPGSPP
jgi:DNA-binding transcriptional LysR family regulator